MRTLPSRAARRCAGAAVLTLAFVIAGCAPRLEQPLIAVSPYEQPQTWAVAPFTNESGVSRVDTARVADLFVQELHEVYGIAVVPVNRAIVAMRELEMDHVRTAADARSLMRLLEVDGLVIGAVTAYDPYRPMTLGMAVELHTQERRQEALLDPRRLTRLGSGEIAPGTVGPEPPAAQAAGIFDAGNHQTLAWLDEYATGRYAPESGYGRDVYHVSMDRYTQFVSHRLIRALLEAEQARLIAAAVESPPR